MLVVYEQMTRIGEFPIVLAGRLWLWGFFVARLMQHTWPLVDTWSFILCVIRASWFARVAVRDSHPLAPHTQIPSPINVRLTRGSRTITKEEFQSLYYILRQTAQPCLNANIISRRRVPRASSRSSFSFPLPLLPLLTCLIRFGMPCGFLG